MRSFVAIAVAAVFVCGLPLTAQQPRLTAPGETRSSGPLIVPDGRTRVVPTGVDPVRPPDRAAPSVTSNSQHVEESYFSIVGAVHYPGTYATRRTQILLSELIDRAGGLTNEATGSVRLLDNRRRDLFSYSPGLPPVSVAAGSVIVAEPNRPGPHASTGGAAEFTDVVCLNLLDRPVVLWLKPKNATVTNLLSNFGQPDELRHSVQELSPHRGVALSRSMLNSGTVLFFDADAVDRQSLAAALRHRPLQDVQPLEEPADAASQPPPDVVAALETLRRGMSPQPADSTPATTEFPSQPALLPKRTLPPPVVVQKPGGPSLVQSNSPGDRAEGDSVVPNTPPISQAVKLDERAPNRPATASRSLSAVAAAAESKPVIAAQQPTSSVAAMIGLSTENAQESPQRSGRVASTFSGVRPRPPEDSQPKARSWFSGLGAIALGTGTLAALCLCGAIGWSHWERRRRKRANRESSRSSDSVISGAAHLTVSPSTSILDQLISNTMPLIEEETVFPETLSFHGRLVGYRYLLHSEPHSLRGPHFAARQRQGARTVVTANAAVPAAEPKAPVTQSAGVETTRGGHRDVSPLERALRATMRAPRPEKTE